MNSRRPYLLRALNEWILDNGMTPHILVDANDDSARLPMEYARDGKIVFNISPRAVVDLLIGDDAVTFHARLGGRPFEVHMPLRAVLAIYARENGRGMVLPPEEEETPSARRRGKTAGKPRGKPGLKLVK